MSLSLRFVFPHARPHWGTHWAPHPRSHPHAAGTHNLSHTPPLPHPLSPAPRLLLSHAPSAAPSPRGTEAARGAGAGAGTRDAGTSPAGRRGAHLHVPEAGRTNPAHSRKTFARAAGSPAPGRPRTQSQRHSSFRSAAATHGTLGRGGDEGRSLGGGGAWRRVRGRVLGGSRGHRGWVSMQPGPGGVRTPRPPRGGELPRVWRSVSPSSPGNRTPLLLRGSLLGIAACPAGAPLLSPALALLGSEAPSATSVLQPRGGHQRVPGVGGWPRVQPRTDLTRLQVLLSWTWESPLQAFLLPLWSAPPRLALLGHRRVSRGESTSALSFDHHPLVSGVHTLSGAGTQKPHITRDSVLPLSSPPGMVAPSCTSHNLEPPGTNRIPLSEPPARRVGGASGMD